ncbi:hypothetical protein [Porphyrobacter sp. YT40]|uniref:hypothetical protein n=1 Tax=Porphyrobacter sp. YT40 TaxID=2547601 RepID=UPI0011439DC1|nr:hypothetical protein [Porphyrobacter sp. YT40]QDH34747.1 hypothetical protein E2E27_10685 [Porphyrobacter sp. YT40]
MAALAGCSAADSPPPAGDTVDCAIGAGAELSPDCVLERVSTDRFVIHHPDGGFRRFVRVEESGDLGLRPADGAEVVSEERWQGDGLYLLAFEGEKYRFPIALLKEGDSGPAPAQ